MNLSLTNGEVVCLIGPNGAGKSTLLRTLAGVQLPLQGHVTLGGKDIHAMAATVRARRIAVVLSRRVDVGALTAREIVSLGRYPHTGWWGHLSSHDWVIVDRALAAAAANDLAMREVATLSDGEWQKVMIARALAQEPHVLLLDEPTAFLDVHHRAEIMALLRSLAHEQGRAVLLSTHDLDLALYTADQLWVITAAGEVHTGAPEDLVLAGVLESVFPSRHVTFDLRTGTFRVPREIKGYVGLIGNGVHAYWTRRALERTGWQVVRDTHHAQATVRIIENGDRIYWLIRWQNEERIYSSLQEVLAHLKTEIGKGRFDNKAGYG